jgi:hypothetical protein
VQIAKLQYQFNKSPSYGSKSKKRSRFGKESQMTITAMNKAQQDFLLGSQS